MKFKNCSENLSRYLHEGDQACDSVIELVVAESRRVEVEHVVELGYNLKRDPYCRRAVRTAVGTKRLNT
jgi:hypothetical protein